MSNLPKKYDKLTAEHFKFVRPSDVVYYWSFKFSTDGLTENEIVIHPYGEGCKVTVFDRNGAALLPSKTVKIALKKVKGEQPTVNQKDGAKILKAVNDLYSKFYE